MLKKFLPINLQLFGEGGDGGDGGSASPAGESVVDNTGEDLVKASIPEKARKFYEKAMAKQSSEQKQSSPKEPSSQPQTTTEAKAEEKLSYADMIKSDDYREEHEAYMKKTLGDRLKKYKGMEAEHGKAMATLEIVANKYGVNPDDEHFLEVLGQKIEEDDSYYEKYAMEHDMTAQEARRMVTMERKATQLERAETERKAQEQRLQQFQIIQQNAAKTKAQFPQFDLETEFQDERFRRLCLANNGDTTAAYMACHWNDIIPAQVQMAAQQIQSQTAAAVAANQSRPVENGLSSTAPSTAKEDFRGMSLEQLRAYAEQERRKKRGR